MPINMSGKIIFSSQQFAKMLKPLMMCINTSSVLPILDSVLIQCTKGVGTLTASDLETTVIRKFECEQRGEWTLSICVNARQLFGFLNKVEDQPIVMEYQPDKKSVVLNSDTITVRVPVENPDNYLKITEVSDENSFTLDYRDVFPDLKKALVFTSSDDLRPAMTGVYMHDGGEEGFKIVATDAHRLLHKQISPVLPACMKGKGFIIPKKSIRVAELALNHMLLDQVKFCFSDTPEMPTSLSMANDIVTVICRTIDATYPNYTSVLVKPETHFYLIRKQLNTFLSIALNYINRSMNQVTMAVTASSIKIVGEDVDYDMGVSYTVPVYNCNELDLAVTFSCNAKMLIDALRMTKDEYVKISTMKSPTKAFIIDDWIMQMPLLLNQ
jgi:DNA polymerase-3 subunit beta